MLTNQHLSIILLSALAKEGFLIERFILFINNINQIYRCVQKIKSSEMTEFGLKGMHVMCIFHLNHAKTTLTAAQLSAICSQDKAAISRAVSELGAKGLLVSNEQENQPKYRAPITLTKRGKEVANKMDQVIKLVADKGGDGLTNEQRMNFYQVLTLIANNLKTYTLEE